MENGATIEIPLPEAMIQHIHSYMSGKEAARSVILSRSWYNAWLTRPTLDFDNLYLKQWDLFVKFAEKTMQRYQDLCLKIQSFRLRVCCNDCGSEATTRKLIAGAMEAGAIDLKLVFPNDEDDIPPYTLPQEVVGSKTLIKLCVRNCKIDGKYVVSGSRLKSLSLINVRTLFNVRTRDSYTWFKDIMISCCDSLEELSLSCFKGLTLRRVDMNELPKLRRLFLGSVNVECFFFSDFASRFPCLKDLTVLDCHGWRSIQIASTSLETIRFETQVSGWATSFDAPNIRKFTYSGSGTLPSYSLIKGGSREWELDISVTCNGLYSTSWFLNLKRLLTEFNPSRISSLRINLDEHGRCWSPEHEIFTEAEAEAEPVVVVENLIIYETTSPFRCDFRVENLMMYKTTSPFRCDLLVRLFRICRPKFITHYWRRLKDDRTLDVLCKKLMQDLIAPNCGIPDQDMFGLKKVNMEVYQKFDDKEWWPLELEKPLDATEILENTPKVHFELIWD